MKDISAFFDKFKYILQSDAVQKDVIAEILHSLIHIDIDPKKITIKNGYVYIPSSSLVKNEIHLKKAQILTEIEKRLQKRVVNDIR